MRKLAFISQPEFFRFIYEHDLDKYFIVKEFPFVFSMTEGDFDKLVEFDADYNIFFRGEFFPENVLKKLRGKKIALSSEPFPRKIDNHWEYSLDSVKRYLLFRNNIRMKSFDYIFHYDISSLPLFESDGLKISGEFIFPVARGLYKSKNKAKEWDIFFIGRSTEHREQLFGQLKHHCHFLHIAHGIWGQELVDYIDKSKICLNIHAEEEISWEPRVQMMLACRAFVISEKITPNRYLRPGTDYIEISDEKDLFEKVNYYLRSQRGREKIIRNTEESIDKYFDSKKVFLKFIRDIDEDKYPKFEVRGRENLIFRCLGYIRGWAK